jgi:HD-GYP domain-containing protein (c-di-GMP phosphodiesterase class II)
MSDPTRPSVRPADERLREQGHEIIMRFLAMVRVGRSYQVENKVFHQQIVSFIGALAGVFAEAPEAVLISLDNDLYLNGVRLPVKSASLRFHQALMEEFARRRVAGVRILEGIGEDELERFFRLFLRPDLYHGPELLEACLAQSTGRILPAVHASTAGSDSTDPFDPRSFGAWSGAQPGAGFGVPEAGGGGGGRGGDGDGDDVGTSDGDSAPAPGPPGVRPAARKSYSLALLGARSLLTTTALQEGMEMRHAKRVVQPIIDRAFAGEPVVVGLASLSHHDEYTYAHSVNVCVVAVTMGHLLGLDRRALADLGVASLLHDVGKAAVYDRIRHPLEEMDPEERRLAESHPLEGAKLIARSTTLNPSTLRCMQVALEHHAPRGPQGAGAGDYPALPGAWRTSRLSAIVSVADCFVSLQMHRSARGRDVTPYQALGMMLGPLAGRFEPVMLWTLTRTVGFYPPGQLVELSDGSVAAVLAPNRADLGRPHVRVVVDSGGVPFSPIEAKELRPIPATLGVRRALSADEYPVVPLAA